MVTCPAPGFVEALPSSSHTKHLVKTVSNPNRKLVWRARVLRQTRGNDLDRLCLHRLVHLQIVHSDFRLDLAHLLRSTRVLLLLLLRFVLMLFVLAHRGSNPTNGESAARDGCRRSVVVLLLFLLTLGLLLLLLLLLKVLMVLHRALLVLTRTLLLLTVVHCTRSDASSGNGARGCAENSFTAPCGALMGAEGLGRVVRRALVAERDMLASLLRSAGTRVEPDGHVVCAVVF